MTVPSNLIPSTVVQLPEYSGTSPDGWLPYVVNGVTYKTTLSQIALSGTGTVTSVNASGGTTGLTFSGGPITGAGTLTLSGVLTEPNGGTGETTYANGQLLIGNASGGLTKATLIEGANITITNGDGTITIAAAGGGGGSGTVTSVGGTGTVNGITLTGTVTTSGNLTLGGALTGVSLTTQVSGTLPVANGGTGATTLTAFGVLYGNGTSAIGATSVGSSGQVLTSNGAGVAPTFQSVAGTGDVVGPASATADVPALFSGTTGKLLKNSTPTGTGNPVMQTSPSLTTPNIGTPSAGVLTNCTGLPAAGGGTGQSTYAVGDILQASASTTLSKLAAVATGNVLISGGITTVSSWGKVGLTTHVSGVLPVANGGTNASSASITAFNNITGFTAAGATGTTSTNLVFSTSPTLVTPILGTPTSGTLSNCTVDGTDAVGFRNIPVNSQSTAYTTVLADSGKSILHPIGDNNARTFTIAANASVAYPVGTVLAFENMINTVTIAINSDTLYLAGTGSTGSRTLAAYGMASAHKITSTSWLISGVGLT